MGEMLLFIHSSSKSLTIPWKWLMTSEMCMNMTLRTRSEVLK
jgi:hypothetical protein